jgi:hypothetical protein
MDLIFQSFGCRKSRNQHPKFRLDEKKSLQNEQLWFKNTKLRFEKLEVLVQKSEVSVGKPEVSGRKRNFRKNCFLEKPEASA